MVTFSICSLAIVGLKKCAIKGCIIPDSVQKIMGTIVIIPMVLCQAYIFCFTFLMNFESFFLDIFSLLWVVLIVWFF